MYFHLLWPIDTFDPLTVELLKTMVLLTEAKKQRQCSLLFSVWFVGLIHQVTLTIQAVWRVKTTLKEEVSTQCPKLFGVALILPDFALWLVQKTRATLSTNQMQTKTNHDLVARVFPRLRQLGCFCIEFSLALNGNFLPSHWLLSLFWFEFYDT